MSNTFNFDNIPDVRDGLNKKERAILYCLQQAQQELSGRGGLTKANVPTMMLYGRVVELVDISPQEFQTILARLVGLTRESPE